MNLHQSISDLADAAKALLAVKAETMNLTTEQIASIRPYREVTPASVPVLPTLRGPLPPMSLKTQAVCEALQAAAPLMQWRRSYSEADGFPKSYLDSYGWFDLAGPDGPYTADGLRIMFGYWGAGLHYPDHSHVQEEHYLVLAGSSWFRLGAQPYQRVGPGQVFHTPPNAVHAAKMQDEPLLAMAIWRAEDLTVRVHLTESDHEVEVG